LLGEWRKIIKKVHACFLECLDGRMLRLHDLRIWSRSGQPTRPDVSAIASLRWSRHLDTLLCKRSKKMDRGLQYGIATIVQNLWKSGRRACQYASIAIARQVADEKYTYTHTLHETRPASTDINQRRTEIVGSRIQEHAGNVSLVCIDRNDGDI